MTNQTGSSQQSNGWQHYVALGDSFTEGMCDPSPSGHAHPWRGWADRVAEALAGQAHRHGDPFEYANLATRGRLLGQIVDEQVPAALTLAPDLVSIVGGGNDVMRPGVDVDQVAGLLEKAVAQLRGTGATVLLATPSDPRQAPLVRRIRGAAAVFAADVWSIAQRHHCLVLDLWGMPILQDRRMWAADRIHLTAEGHRRVAEQALGLLDVPLPEEATAAARAVLAPLPPRSRQQAWVEDAAWAREHLLPWIGRRVRGRSSGDGLPPKRPTPAPVTPIPCES